MHKGVWVFGHGIRLRPAVDVNCYISVLQVNFVSTSDGLSQYNNGQLIFFYEILHILSI